MAGSFLAFALIIFPDAYLFIRVEAVLSLPFPCQEWIPQQPDPVGKVMIAKTFSAGVFMRLILALATGLCEVNLMRAEQPPDSVHTRAASDREQFIVFNISATAPAPVFQEVAREFKPIAGRPLRVGLGAVFSYLRHSPEQVRGALEEFLKLAQLHSIPVVVQLDGEQWMEARPDLWNWWDPKAPGFNPSNRFNVEWSGWQPEDAVRIGWRNWGHILRVLPPPNLMSPAYRTACHAEMNRLVPVIVDWWHALPADQRGLLIGVKVGWESSIGVNAWYYPGGNQLAAQPPALDPTNGLRGSLVPDRGMAQIGYAAVTTAGLRRSGHITESDLAEVVRLHLEDLSRRAAELGLPRDKLFTHAGGWKDDELLYGSAVNGFSCPGWSFYRHADDPHQDTAVQRALARCSAPYWAAVEWLYRGTNSVESWTRSMGKAFVDPRCRFLCMYNWENVGKNPVAREAVRRMLDSSQPVR